MSLTTGNTKALWAGAPMWEPVQIPQAAVSVNSQAPGTIGTNCFLLGSIPPTLADGAYLHKVRLAFTSTTGAVNIAATNINIFLSTINTGATSAADTFLYETVQIPAQTISGATVAPIFFERPLMIAVQSARYVLVAQTLAAAANGAWVAHLLSGGY